MSEHLNVYAGEIEISYEGVQNLDEVFARLVAAIQESSHRHSEVVLALDTEALDQEIPKAVSSHTDAVAFLFDLIECGRRYGITIQICPSHKVISLIYQPQTDYRIFLHARETSH